MVFSLQRELSQQWLTFNKRHIPTMPLSQKQQPPHNAHPLMTATFHKVSVTWVRPNSRLKNPTDEGVTRCVFKDNKILSPYSQFFWSMWRIKNVEVEHGLQIKYEKYRILWLKIITLLVLRCFLQALCINLTASICQEESSNYKLISNYMLMIIVNPFPW